MTRGRYLAILVAACLLLGMEPSAHAHLDAPRISLPQLYMAADLVAIVHIDTVELRTFGEGKDSSRYEVVTATVSDQYKGRNQRHLEFFQYAHGHAVYRGGDRAVLFLQSLDEEHQLYAIGRIGKIHYVSHQVRNTEHLLREEDLADYRWVLQSYTDLAADGEPGSRLKTLSAVMLRMLQSDSPGLMESALLDWAAAGGSIEFSDAELDTLENVVRDPAKPIGLRLALLRELSRRKKAEEKTWTWLLANENDRNLSFVLSALTDYNKIQLRDPLIAMLQHPSVPLAEGAARALGHPIYTGAEASLHSLLASENQRLNYAAVQGLAGIDSSRSRTMLAEAAEQHPNAKVRRMISARLKLHANFPNPSARMSSHNADLL